MFCISGEPNKGKTALSKVALSLCSNKDFLFSYKVNSLKLLSLVYIDIGFFQSTVAWFSSLCEKSSLLAVLGKL